MSDYIDYAAQAYGYDPGVLHRVNSLENSGSDAFTVNDYDSNAKKGTPSAGPFQFIEPTFKSYAAQAVKANPNAWKGIAVDWRNPKAQALAAAWALKNGHGSAWTTYKKALAGQGSAAPSRAAAHPAVASTYGLTANQPAFSASRFGGSKKSDQWFGNFVDTALSQRAQVAAPTAPVAGSAVASGGPAPAKSAIGSSYKGIEALGSKYGLNVQGEFQTTGGKHTPGSLHYAGKAVDFGDATNSHAKLFAFADYAKAHPEQFKELFFNPLGWGIKNGKIVQGLTVAGHDDHLHAAVF